MIKKKGSIKNTVFIICFSIGILFVSCSSDDEGSDNNGVVELPADVLGAYAGALSAPPVEVFGTATIVKSGTKTYTINFSDDVPSLTNLEFVASVIDNDFISSTKDKDRGLAISLIMDNGVRLLGVAKTSDPNITFGGEKLEVKK